LFNWNPQQKSKICKLLEAIAICQAQKYNVFISLSGKMASKMGG